MTDHRTEYAHKRKIDALEAAVENLRDSMAQQNSMLADMRNALHAAGGAGLRGG